jgi:hypothetical protein
MQSVAALVPPICAFWRLFDEAPVGEGVVADTYVILPQVTSRVESHSTGDRRASMASERTHRHKATVIDANHNARMIDSTVEVRPSSYRCLPGAVGVRGSVSDAVVASKRLAAFD